LSEEGSEEVSLLHSYLLLLFFGMEADVEAVVATGMGAGEVLAFVFE